MGAINDKIETEVSMVDSIEDQALKIATESIQKLKDKNITVFECPQCGEIHKAKWGVRLIKCNKCGWTAPPSDAELERQKEMERRKANRLKREEEKKNGKK